MNISTTNTDLTRVFAALGDSTRYRIFQLLMKYPDICVSGLAEELGLSVSAVSQQCKLLEMSGLINRQRSGQQICYQVRQDNPDISTIIQLVRE